MATLYPVGNLSLDFRALQDEDAGTKFTFQFNRRVALHQGADGEFEGAELKFQHTFKVREMGDENGLLLRTVVCERKELEKATDGLLDVKATLHNPELLTPQAHLETRINEFGKTLFFRGTMFQGNQEVPLEGLHAAEDEEAEDVVAEAAHQAVLVLQDKPGGRNLASSNLELVPSDAGTAAPSSCVLL